LIKLQKRVLFIEKPPEEKFPGCQNS